MPASLIDFLAGGLLQFGWPAMLLYLLVVTQVTIFTVTLYLHRSQAHRGVDFHPVIAHFFRFWSWLTTSMITREWAAIHRKHHARCETPEDPHSPMHKGIGTVLWKGGDLYREARLDRASIEQYGKGCPDDWVERTLYTGHANLGVILLLALSFLLFGAKGVAAWAIQMAWIPFWAAGVINGLGHWWGYRNFETTDTATNLTPWAVWIGGEELHNNHHAFPSSARFAMRKWEFDIGWAAIRLLQALKLAKVLRVAPSLDVRPNIAMPDGETLKALVAHRFQAMTDYQRNARKPRPPAPGCARCCRASCARASSTTAAGWARMRVRSCRRGSTRGRGSGPWSTTARNWRRCWKAAASTPTSACSACRPGAPKPRPAACARCRSTRRA